MITSNDCENQTQTSLSITHDHAGVSQQCGRGGRCQGTSRHHSQPSFMSESQTCLGHGPRQKQADQKIEDDSGAPVLQNRCTSMGRRRAITTAIQRAHQSRLSEKESAGQRAVPLQGVGQQLALPVCTRPDIAQAVGVLTRHMARPSMLDA